MVERRFGWIVNITSASVKMPLEGLDLSSGARADLIGFPAGIARSAAHANVTINFLLPGSFDTRRLQSGQEAAAKQLGIPVEMVVDQRRAVIPVQRFGEPHEFGKVCAFRCSSHAGHITGQNLVIDGGAYPAVPQSSGRGTVGSRRFHTENLFADGTCRLVLIGMLL
jgi:3-oxoacyl-[acyl-carrier protein] reductase